jgi:secretory lipase
VRESRSASKRGSVLVRGIAAAVVGLAIVAQSASATVLTPAKDPFYTYSGKLSRIAPGTILKSRSVTVDSLAAFPTPLPAEQLLFRTTDQVGDPALAVTTVIQPASSSTPRKIMSWQTFYDTLGSQCDPSYELQGGGDTFPTNPADCEQDGQEEGSAAETFLSEGATIVITDYEGTNEAYAAGGTSGYATLDGIRAAEKYLKYTPATTPVAMIGYSGGATASEWAAELAAKYAPKLDIVGTAAGGVLASPIQTLQYIDGGATGWAGVIPVGLFALERGFHIDLTPYLSPLGEKVMDEDQALYINDLVGGFNYMQQLLKPKYANFTHVPAFARALGALKMGRGTPDAPIFLGNGEGMKANGYDGDGVMVTTAVTALAQKYCQKGVAVEYQEYPGLTHVEAAGPFLAYAIPWLSARLAGAPTVSNCAAIETGSAPAVYPAGNTCSSDSTTSSCTASWSSDSTGWYWGFTSGSWTVQELQCTADLSTCSSWKTIASGGAGSFSSSPGGLSSGHVYQLIVNGAGEGGVGTFTGNGPV